MEQLKITWRGIELAITYTPEKLEMVDHIELHADNKVALPVTEMGYRSH